MEMNKEPAPMKLNKVKSQNATSMRLKSKKTVFSPRSAGLGIINSQDPLSSKSIRKESEKLKPIDNFISNEQKSNSDVVSNDSQQHGPQVDAIQLIEQNLGQLKETDKNLSDKAVRAAKVQVVNEALDINPKIDKQPELKQVLQSSQDNSPKEYEDNDDNLGQSPYEPAKFILKTNQRPLSKQGNRATKHSKVVFNKRFDKTSKSRTRGHKKIKVSIILNEFCLFNGFI